MCVCVQIPYIYICINLCVWVGVSVDVFVCVYGIWKHIYVDRRIDIMQVENYHFYYGGFQKIFGVIFDFVDLAISPTLKINQARTNQIVFGAVQVADNCFRSI